jgi:hypothetical protein
MFTHPYISSQLARERQRDMLTQAREERLARQLRHLARASRRAAWDRRQTMPSVSRSRRAALLSQTVLRLLQPSRWQPVK